MKFSLERLAQALGLIVILALLALFVPYLYFLPLFLLVLVAFVFWDRRT